MFSLILVFTFLVSSYGQSPIQVLKCDNNIIVFRTVDCLVGYSSNDIGQIVISSVNDFNKDKTILVLNVENQTYTEYVFPITYNTTGIKKLSALYKINDTTMQTMNIGLKIYKAPTIDYFYCSKKAKIKNEINCNGSITADLVGIPFHYFYELNGYIGTLSFYSTDKKNQILSSVFYSSSTNLLKFGLAIDIDDGPQVTQAVKVYSDSLTCSIPTIYTGFQFDMYCKLTTTLKGSTVLFDYGNWFSDSQFAVDQSSLTLGSGYTNWPRFIRIFEYSLNFLLLSTELTEDVWINYIEIYAYFSGFIKLKIVKFDLCGYYDGWTCRLAILNNKNNTLGSKNVRVINTTEIYLTAGYNQIKFDNSTSYEIGCMFMISLASASDYGIIGFKLANNVSDSDCQTNENFTACQYLTDSLYNTYFKLLVNLKVEKFFKVFSLKSQNTYKKSGNYKLAVCALNRSICFKTNLTVQDKILFTSVCSGKNCQSVSCSTNSCGNNVCNNLIANETLTCSISIQSMRIYQTSIDYGDQTNFTSNNYSVSNLYMSHDVGNFMPDTDPVVDFSTDYWFICLLTEFVFNDTLYGFEIYGLESGIISFKLFNAIEVLNPFSQTEFDKYPTMNLTIKRGYNNFSFPRPMLVQAGNMVAFKYINDGMISFSTTTGYSDLLINGSTQEINSTKNVQFCIRNIVMKSYFKSFALVTHSYDQIGQYYLRAEFDSFDNKSVYGVLFSFGIINYSTRITTTTTATTTATTTTKALIISGNFSNYLNENPTQVLEVLTNSKQDLIGCMSGCSNRGACAVENNNYKCKCDKFFSGNMCQVDLRACSKQPCINEGICIQDQYDFALFYCNCSEIFYGTNCQLKINVCENTTCSNNGYCIEVSKQPVCNCFQMYSGLACEIKSGKLVTIQAIVSTTSIVAVITVISFFLTIFLLDVLDWYSFIKAKRKLKLKA